MRVEREMTMLNRRQLLKVATMAAGGAALGRLYPDWFAAYAQQPAAAPADPIAAMRAAMAMAPIERTQLTNNLALLSGPGGNVLILAGPDGKIVVDSFVQPV